MRAVLTDLSIPRYLLMTAAQGLPRAAVARGLGSPALLALRDDAPSWRWARRAPR